MSSEVLFWWGVILASPAAYFLGRNVIGWLFDRFDKVSEQEKVTVIVSLKGPKGEVKAQSLDLKDIEQVVSVLDRANEASERRAQKKDLKLS